MRLDAPNSPFIKRSFFPQSSNQFQPLSSNVTSGRIRPAWFFSVRVMILILQS
jgi:hypothetical protein